MCNNPTYMQSDAMEKHRPRQHIFLVYFFSAKWNKCIEIIENGKINRKRKHKFRTKNRIEMKIKANIKGEKEYAERREESFFNFFFALSA